LPIPYFAEHQNDVFIPALVAVLVATVLLVLPAIAGTLLARIRGRAVIRALTIALGAVALVIAVQQTVVGFRELDEQHDSVQRAIGSRYGLQLSGEQVSSLLEGGTVKVAAAGPVSAVRLTRRDDGDYTLTDGKGHELPVTG
jgi:energy-coupling factor transporter transmembrane protein EcfT